MGSQGAQFVVDEDNNIVEERYERVAFETIEQMDPEHRREKIRERLLDANVSMQNKKTDAMIKNFELIKTDHWDPAGLKDAFQALEDGDEKVRFLQQFNQIADKYGRNIGMDLYHPDFRNYFVIDSRIKRILEAVGYDVEEHDDYEE